MNARRLFTILTLLAGLTLPAGAIRAQDPTPETLDEPDAVQAGPGDLDPTFAGFSGNGKVADSPIAIRAMALQADDKIVVAGVKDGTFALARYNPDGALDATFGASGVVTTTILSTQVEAGAYAIAIQPNGKIVAAGYVAGSDVNFAVVRYNANGSLDTSFSGNGKTAPDFDGGYDVVYAVAIQGDGKIVVAGKVWDIESAAPDDYDIGVLRLNPNGSPDSGFGNNGWVNIGFGDNDGARAVALQPDGKILVAGYREEACVLNCSYFADDCVQGYNPKDFDFALARLNSDGSLDNSFGLGGKLATDMGGYDCARAIAVQPDGRIVAAGSRSLYGSTQYRFALARYLSNGALDSTFAGDGKLITEIEDSRANDVIIQSDGKIVAAGVGGSNAQFALARYNVDGALDNTFTGDGKVFTDFIPADHETAHALALQPDGRLVAAGGRYLSRYFPDGSLDAGGRQTVAFDALNLEETASAVVVQPDSKIVTVGTYEGITDAFALSRHNVDGTLDTTFGSSGRVFFDFGWNERARAIARQTDGKLVVAGIVDPGGQDNFILVRFHPNGGYDCHEITDFHGDDDWGLAVALAPDQKIVVAGRVRNDAENVTNMGVARYNANCTLDTSFAGGKVEIDFGGHESAQAVVVQPDGKVVVAGIYSRDIALARLNANGTLDTSFDRDGRLLTDTGASDAAYGLALQSDGKLIVAGFTSLNGDYDFLLARYNTDGSLDDQFGDGGYNITDFAGSDIAYGVVVRADDTIIVAGCSTANGVDQFAVAQYTPDGLLDDAFGGDGKTTTRFGAKDDCALDVAVRSSGQRVVAVGYSTAGDNRNFAIAQYLTTSQEAGLFRTYLPAVMK